MQLEKEKFCNMIKIFRAKISIPNWICVLQNKIRTQCKVSTIQSIPESSKVNEYLCN